MNYMAEVTRDQIIEAARNQKQRRELMHVSEMGGDIWVKGQSGTDRDRDDERFRIKTGRKAGQVNLSNFRAFKSAQVIVNSDGSRKFSDDDAKWLGDFPSGVLDRILAKSAELSGATDDEAEEIKNGSASEDSATSS